MNKFFPQSALWIFLLFMCLPSLGRGEGFPLYESNGVLGADVDVEGHVRRIIKASRVDFGEGLQLPLNFVFNSKEQKASPYLGNGWSCPLLESGCWPLNEQEYAVKMLGGKIIYFFRDAKDSSKFLHRSNEWTGTLKGDEFVIKGEGKTEMGFRNGLIFYIVTDNGRRVEWQRTGGVVTQLREIGKEPVLKIDNPTGRFAEAIWVNGRKVALEKDLATLSVGKMSWDNGNSIGFQKHWDKEGRPMLDEVRAQITRSFTWNAKSGSILSDGVWNYNVQIPMHKVDGKDVPIEGVWPRVDRQNILTKAKEFYFYDIKTGIASTGKSDGSVIKEYEFLSPGPLFRQNHKIEEIDKKGNVRILARNSYDEAGHLIKTVQNPGYGAGEIENKFSADGQLLSQSINGVAQNIVPEIKQASEVGGQLSGAADTRVIEPATVKIPVPPKSL